MNQHLGPKPGYEFYAHEDSAKVEKNERLRAGVFIVLIFVLLSALFFQFLVEGLAAAIYQGNSMLNQVGAEGFVIAGAILIVLELSVLIKTVKTIHRFKDPTSDKQRGMIGLVLRSLLLTFILPFLLYLAYYQLLALNAWPNALYELWEIIA